MEIKAVSITSVTSSAKESGEVTVVGEQGVEKRSKVEVENLQDISQEKSYTKEEIDKEIEHLNKWFEAKNSHLKFVLHDKLNKYYVQVVDDNTNEVIKEIPSEKVMDMVAIFYEKLGIIIDKKA